MKSIILGAEMREALMRAYLSIQLDEDRDALTVDYAARLSTMPDAELVERLTEYSRDAFNPNRTAQEALLKWRQSKSAPALPAADADGKISVVSAVLSVVYKLDDAADEAALVEGLKQELQGVIDAGDILTASNSAEVVDYGIAVY